MSLCDESLPHFFISDGGTKVKSKQERNGVAGFGHSLIDESCLINLKSFASLEKTILHLSMKIA